MRVTSPCFVTFLVIAGGLSAACGSSASVARIPKGSEGALFAVGRLTDGLSAIPPSNVCAALPGIVLPPASVASDLIVTALGGEPAPVGFGQPAPGVTAMASGFEWTEDEIAAVRDLPFDFGPRNASTLVAEFPTRIDQFLETVNTFESLGEAARWFATWPGVSALSHQEVEPGATRNAIPAVALLTQADEAEVTTWSRPGVDLPADVQYVMRSGNTVITIEFFGGEQVSNASTEPYARLALALVVRKCSGLPGA